MVFREGRQILHNQLRTEKKRWSSRRGAELKVYFLIAITKQLPNISMCLHRVLVKTLMKMRAY
jgi:hypothetical protein